MCIGRKKNYLLTVSLKEDALSRNRVTIAQIRYSNAYLMNRMLRLLYQRQKKIVLKWISVRVIAYVELEFNKYPFVGNGGGKCFFIDGKTVILLLSE